MKGMRIVQLTTNFQTVDSRFGKAIGSHVGALTDGLVQRGHELHVFGPSDSQTRGEVHGVTETLKKGVVSPELAQHLSSLSISKCYEFAADNSDIVHSHFTLLSSYFAAISTVPTVISVHSPIDEHMRTFANAFKNVRYISFSLAQRKLAPELNWYANIYHGVDTKTFVFNALPENYVLYLGRITEDKGVHHAIEAAKAAGYPLLIAGSSYPAEGYWQKYIEPHINGASVRYVGNANLEEKIKLLQGARALLFPTQWNEVFGYVMIEAMACGTPVIGFANGSVPEIVQDGVSGFVVNDAQEMTDALLKIGTIDRDKVRQRAEQYFSLEKMISGYEKIYKRVIADAAFYKNKRASSESSGG